MALMTDVFPAVCILSDGYRLINFTNILFIGFRSVLLEFSSMVMAFFIFFVLLSFSFVLLLKVT